MSRKPRDFESLVDKTGECWLWLGARNQDGYGLYGHSAKAHRVAWERISGPIPPGLSVLHRCDNPPCVRPDHLFLGTNHDNILDRQAKGRSKNLFPAGAAHPGRVQSGERHWATRLSDAQVIEIRVRRAAGETATALAREFGVNNGTISRLARGIGRQVA